MIADLKPYPEYKESGLPWLGQVPGHWEHAPNRGALLPKSSERSESRRRGTAVRLAYSTGVIVADSSTAKQSRRHQPEICSRATSSFDHGDFVLTTACEPWQACDRGVDTARDHQSGVRRLCVLRAATTRLLRDCFFESRMAAVQRSRSDVGVRDHATCQSLDLSDFKMRLIPLPPPDEQAAIVRFLDWANGRLERAIRAKRKVIALLNEQKQAIIHRAVTRGLDPSVPLKPSGIPWLGDIPQHWEVRRVKQLDSRAIDRAVRQAYATKRDYRGHHRLTERRRHGRSKQRVTIARSRESHVGRQAVPKPVTSCA